MKLPAFESIEEKMNEIAAQCTTSQRDKFDISVMSYKCAIRDRDVQWSQAIEQLKAKVLKHKEAYSLDIFPNSEKLDENSTRDSISARMETLRGLKPEQT